MALSKPSYQAGDYITVEIGDYRYTAVVFATSPVIEDDDTITYTVTCRDVTLVERHHDYDLYDT